MKAKRVRSLKKSIEVYMMKLIMLSKKEEMILKNDDRT